VAKRLYLNNEVEPATFRQSRNNPLERTFPKGRPCESEKIKNDENPWVRLPVAFTLSHFA
ncbi:MAG: hypothetical protein SH807_09205, partial [Blastochloris sp.]|nr:hypothetical protein [Blastochloris sp.]